MHVYILHVVAHQLAAAYHAPQGRWPCSTGFAVVHMGGFGWAHANCPSITPTSRFHCQVERQTLCTFDNHDGQISIAALECFSLSSLPKGWPPSGAVRDLFFQAAQIYKVPLDPMFLIMSAAAADT